jgi:hypothetical protein
VNGNIPAAGNCAVNAGDILAAEMHQQPGDRSCSNEAIGGDHYGPTLIYMASELRCMAPFSCNLTTSCRGQQSDYHHAVDGELVQGQ